MPREKILICGSRDIPEELALPIIEKELTGDPRLICGMARGVDIHAFNYAARNGLKLDTYPADWDKHGKKAGYLRNIDMVNAADRVVAIWDGKSKGTKHSIDYATKIGKPLKVYEVQVDA